MGVVLAGIDEAGYGPMLGPLVVAMSAFEIDPWEPGQPAPDLWDLLSRGVCKKPGKAAKGRIAFDDSKKLKLANDAAKHPLTHLELGVLSMLALLDLRPKTDLELLLALGAELEDHPWYGGEARPLPVAHSEGEIAIASNTLNVAMAQAGVRPLTIRTKLVCERAFNETVRREGTKAATTALGVGEHLRTVWESWGKPGPNHPRLVCDRQGGRQDYGQFLARLLPRVKPGEEPITVTVIEETPRASRYDIELKDRSTTSPPANARRLSAVFQPEAESAHLPVALASMTAKYVRELMMARFNAFWNGQAQKKGLEGLKPTAGYTQDARRWLKDAQGLLSKADRAAMVRNA